MNVAFLTPSLSREAGGIFEIERALARALHQDTPAALDIFGLRDRHTDADREKWAPLQPEAFPVWGSNAFGYAPDLLDALLAADADLLHLHALWMYTSVASLRWARKTGRPHLVTINGMLDEWALRNARWKKYIAEVLFERANLDAAACLQVNSDSERQAVRDFGLTNPVCLIPNGVTLPPDDAGGPPPWRDRIAPDRNVLLFLGRLHPKKGLPALLEAWADVEGTLDDDWTLAIVGWDDGGHEADLRARIQKKNVEHVHVLGPMFGEEKHAAFSHAKGFVLPSHSEGLPMAVLEAWSYGLPILKTPGCNLEVGFDRGAALRIEPRVASIADGISRLCTMPDEERRAIGNRGRRLVEDQFTWTQVAKQMYDVYQWMLGDAERPGTVMQA